MTIDEFTPEGRKIAKLPSLVNANGELECPGCGCGDFEVTNTYRWERGSRKRRRICTNCGWSFHTQETIVPDK